MDDIVLISGAIWTFKALLRGHEMPLFFSISEMEVSILRETISKQIECEFIAFDTKSDRIVLRLDDLVFCHFLEDFIPPGCGVIEGDEEVSYRVRAFFCGNPNPYDFDGDPNVVDEELNERAGGLAKILALLELEGDDAHRYRFTDGDGEVAFLRRGDIAMLRVSLDILERSTDD